jgi:hypothetical protein
VGKSLSEHRGLASLDGSGMFQRTSNSFVVQRNAPTDFVKLALERNVKPITEFRNSIEGKTAIFRVSIPDNKPLNAILTVSSWCVSTELSLVCPKRKRGDAKKGDDQSSQTESIAKRHDERPLYRYIGYAAASGARKTGKSVPSEPRSSRWGLLRWQISLHAGQEKNTMRNKSEV